MLIKKFHANTTIAQIYQSLWGFGAPSKPQFQVPQFLNYNKTAKR